MLELSLEEKPISPEIAKQLGITSNSTFFKYKALLQTETRKEFMALEEKDVLITSAVDIRERGFIWALKLYGSRQRP